MEPDVKRLDATSLKALAHPLRMRLLGLLRIEGPATATQLAARVGESSGATSYHLRQLERHGFVEDDPARGNARDRWWKASHRMTSWRSADFLDQPDTADADTILQHEALRGQVRRIEQWLTDRESYGRDAISAATSSDYTVRLTTERMRALAEELEAVAQRYFDDPDDDDPDAVPAVVLLHVFPERRLP